GHSCLRDGLSVWRSNPTPVHVTSNRALRHAAEELLAGAPECSRLPRNQLQLGHDLSRDRIDAKHTMLVAERTRTAVAPTPHRCGTFTAAGVLRLSSRIGMSTISQQGHHRDVVETLGNGIELVTRSARIQEMLDKVRSLSAVTASETIG